jgi:hypothetical protein
MRRKIKTHVILQLFGPVRLKTEFMGSRGGSDFMQLIMLGGVGIGAAVMAIWPFVLRYKVGTLRLQLAANDH